MCHDCRAAHFLSLPPFAPLPPFLPPDPLKKGELKFLKIVFVKCVNIGASGRMQYPLRIASAQAMLRKNCIHFEFCIYFLIFISENKLFYSPFNTS